MSAGFPAFIMTLFENLSYAVMGKLMSLCGLEQQAGIGVAKKINMLAHSMVRGISQGAMPLLAYNHASMNRTRMKKALSFSSALASGLALLCTAAYVIFAPQLVGLFFKYDSPSLYYGAAFLRILCLGAPFSAAAYSCISFFQAAGHGREAFALALLRKGLLDIPLMFLLASVLPVYGIAAATPVTDAICCAAAVVLLRRYLNRPENRLG